MVEQDVATGVAYFPETAKEAAPQIAREIIDAFNNNVNEADPSLVFGAPWGITTEESSLAMELEQEFRRIGVKEDRCNIFSQSSERAYFQADDVFELYFRTFKMLSGLENIPMATPGAISFPSSHPEETSKLWKSHLDEDEATRALHCKESLTDALIPGHDGLDADFTIEMVLNVRRDLMELIDNENSDDPLPEAMETMLMDALRRQADSGSGMACLHYAMRCRWGIDCKSDRRLCRIYLMKALTCEYLMTERMKALVHALLMDWYVSGCEAPLMRARYASLASHHAEEAIMISRQCITTGDSPIAPAIRRFAVNTFDPPSKTSPILIHLYNSVWEVLQERKKQIEAEDKRMARKRMKSPYKYRCAAEGCSIFSDSKKMLRSCSGKCDVDKKPSYCSRECQKADWANHKPYCKPGAECSVIDDVPWDTASAATTATKGTLKVPVRHADGNVMYLSSSTVSPSVIKEVKTMLEEQYPDGSKTKGITLEINSHPGVDSPMGFHLRC